MMSKVIPLLSLIWSVISTIYRFYFSFGLHIVKIARLYNKTKLFKLFLHILKDLKITRKISSPKQVHETTANKEQIQSSFPFSAFRLNFYLSEYVFLQEIKVFYYGVDY